MKYLVDTDIASYFLRGKYDLNMVFQQKGIDNLALSIVTLAELRVLVYRNPQSVINLPSIGSLSQTVNTLEIDETTWEIYSETKADVLTRGKTRGDLDILNASLAKQHNLIIVTNNTSHYEDLVPVENWTQS